MTVGQRIKMKRESLNISQVDLANKIGCTKQTLYKYENDIITNIPSTNIERIAQALGTTPAYLMGWEDTVKANDDPDIIRIQRARKKMPEKDKKRMMNILKASFEDYFSDNYEDDDLDE